MPHSSISYIWQVTGCQHSLQPTKSDFEAPSIPALTFRGFSRWESLEILLGPEEHVPFMQYAVKNWDLKHPETGESFPSDLPADVFPAQANMEVDRWHQSCAERLKSEAASSAEEGPGVRPSPAAEQSDLPKFTYARPNPFQPTSPRQRAPETDYFGRPMAYSHIPARHASHRRPERSPPREDLPEDRTRRKSFSDYASPSPTAEPPPQYHTHSSTYLDPDMKRSPLQPRRHSHPKHYSSESSDEEPVPDPGDRNAKRRRHPVSPPPPPPSVRRFVPPTAPQPPPAATNVGSSFRAHRSDMRSDDPKRRSVQSPLGSLRHKLSETVSSILPNGLTSDRPRGGSRQNSSNAPVRSRKTRDQLPPSRLSHSYSDLDSDESAAGPTGEDIRRRQRLQDERERNPRGRPRDPDRDWDEDRDSGSRRERPYLRRPETQRRTSSHADVDRQRGQAGWESRDRDRPRDERRKWERRSPEETATTPATGVSGRRYQEPDYS